MAGKNDEAWEHYITERGLILDGRRHEVSAIDLKDVTGREPRLLAKFDTLEEMPVILRNHGYSILPTENGRYLLFRGNIFQPLQPCEDREQITPNLPFRLETAGRGIGEMQYVDHAFNTGIISAFVGVSPLYLTIRGRERSSDFDFAVSGEQIHVSGVQIEVDGGYEGKKDIILVEAKIGLPTSFNIRQLFYPYRRFTQLIPTKRTRPVFLGYDFNAATYSFYEFAFQSSNELSSLQLVRSKLFTLPPIPRLKIEAIEDIRFESRAAERRLAPQADDLNKIMQLLLAIDEGNTTRDELAIYFNFDVRQSSYYAEAAEYLGLILRRHGEALYTDRGADFLFAAIDEKPLYLAKLIVNSWIFQALNDQARAKGSFDSSDIERVLAEAQDEHGKPRYSGSTIPRRRGTIVAWLRWLADTVGCYEEDRALGVFTLK